MTESVESGFALGGGNDDETTRDIPQGKMGLASSLFKLLKYRSDRLILNRMFCCKLPAAVPELSAFVTRVPLLST